MTSGEPNADDESDGSNFVRPSLTLKERHDKLLDELQDARYGSRSEAVRAAIEALAKTITGDGKTNIEQLSTRIEQLGTQVDELAEQIEELQQSSTGVVPNQLSHSETAVNPEQDLPTVESTSSGGDTGLENEIYGILSDQEPVAVSEITENVGANPLEVHESLVQLVDRDFVTSIEKNGTTQYRIKNPRE